MAIKQGDVITAADVVSALNEKAPINMTPGGEIESDAIPTNNNNYLTTILQTIINNLRWIFNSNNIARKNYVDTLFTTDVVNRIYPVGSIYMSVNGTNPGTFWIGTTWTAWGMGRTIIGVGTSDRDFTSDEWATGTPTIGGESTHTLTTAEMPEHTHTFTGNPHNHTIQIYGWYNTGNLPGFDSVNSANVINYTSNSITATGTNSRTGSSNSHNNLQPYITCYFFKRTS